jgi:hypothetical protein
VHRHTHRRGLGLPRRRHRHHRVDLDRTTPDHARARRAYGQGHQGHQGQAGPQGTYHRGDPPLVAQRILSADPDPDARLFTGPRGGRPSRLRAPAPPRPPAHRTHLVRRRRSTRTPVHPYTSSAGSPARDP